MEDGDEKSGFSDLPLWVKEYLAVGIIVCIVVCGIVAHLCNIFPKVPWGDLGDMSGWASTLVSILGFVMVFYQLRQNHEDSKKADKKHEQILDQQISLFNQNAKLALFERRVQVYDAVKTFLVSGTADNIDFDQVREFQKAINHTRFLFPEESGLAKYFDEITHNATQLITLNRKQRRSEQEALIPRQRLTDKEFATFEELILWFGKQYRTAANEAFAPYLSISSFDRPITKTTL